MKKSRLLPLILISVLSGDCSNEPLQERQPTKPCVIVVLQDLSQTFEGYDPWTPELIDSLLQHLARSGKEILFAFGTIGNPDNSSLLRCHLLPVSEPDIHLRLSEKIAHKQKSQQNALQNANAISTFMRQIKILLSAEPTPWTDLNDSMAKAAVLLSESTYSNWDKVLYLHTDGKHDILKGKTRDTVLQCPVWPPGLTVYQSGWKNRIQCESMQSLHDPQSFQSLFQP